MDEQHPTSSFGVLEKDEPVGSATFEEGLKCVSEVDRVSSVSSCNRMSNERNSLCPQESLPTAAIVGR